MTRIRLRRRAAATLALVALTLGLLAGCGRGGATEKTAASGSHDVVRLGYFPNLTHATAIVGVEKGFFAKALGDTASLEPKTFNAGPQAVESLFSGAVDATYIGPGPTVNAFVKSRGEAVRVISGATTGGRRSS